MSLTPIYDDLLRELEEIAQEAGPASAEAAATPASESR